MTQLESLLAGERSRLCRLCARMTGNAHASEDLAQETLLIAWQNRHRLYDDGGLRFWLDAIARNVCLRWCHHRNAEATTYLEDTDLEGASIESADLDHELERKERIELLDLALAWLSPTSRQLLIDRYVSDMPYAEIAGRQGIGEGAARMQVQRAKQALRQTLLTRFPEWAMTYGLLQASEGLWQETRIWCLVCGKRRLLGLQQPEFRLRCPVCHPDPNDFLWQIESLVLFHGVTAYRPRLNRCLQMSHQSFPVASALQAGSCNICGSVVAIQHVHLDSAIFEGVSCPGFQCCCRRCGNRSNACLPGLAIGLPEGRHFWRVHPRLTTLPPQTVRLRGKEAIQIRFADVQSSACWNTHFCAATYQLLEVDPVVGQS